MEDLFGSDSETSQPEQIPEIALPELDYLLQSDAQVFLSRLPGFLQIEPYPFDPTTWQHEIKTVQGTQTDDEEFYHQVRVTVENSIRWRYLKDNQGNVVGKESNARLVRWSDDSLSLLIGNEIFDVITKPVTKQHQFLISQHPSDHVLQAQVQFQKSLSFRPLSTNKITHRVAIKQKKEQTKAKTFTAETHPDIELKEIEKTEMERLKFQRRLEAKKRSEMNKFSLNLTEELLEDAEDDHDKYTRDELDEYEQDFINDEEEEPFSTDDELEIRIKDSKRDREGSDERETSARKQLKKRILMDSDEED